MRLPGYPAVSRRLKKNVAPLSGALDRLLKIGGVTFEWKENDKDRPTGTQTGVIAQDVERRGRRLAPEATGVGAVLRRRGGWSE
jgi:Chaperone of endosialidase